MHVRHMEIADHWDECMANLGNFVKRMLTNNTTFMVPTIERSTRVEPRVYRNIGDAHLGFGTQLHRQLHNRDCVTMLWVPTYGKAHVISQTLLLCALSVCVTSKPTARGHGKGTVECDDANGGTVVKTIAHAALIHLATWAADAGGCELALQIVRQGLVLLPLGRGG
jgi:hypothetical protein